MNSLATLLSKRYLSCITSLPRQTDFSATCIYHIFIIFIRQDLSNNSYVTTGMFYCYMSDHLPCFLSIKTKHKPGSIDKPVKWVFGDKNISILKELTSIYDCDSWYIPDTYWYSTFISVPKQLHLSFFFFPLVAVSRKRAKDKPWTTSLKESAKYNHWNRLCIRAVMQQTWPLSGQICVVIWHQYASMR